LLFPPGGAVCPSARWALPHLPPPPARLARPPAPAAARAAAAGWGRRPAPGRPGRGCV